MIRCIFRSDVSLSVEATNRYYTNSEGSRIVTGELFCRIFDPGDDQGRRRHGAAAVRELLLADGVTACRPSSS